MFKVVKLTEMESETREFLERAELEAILASGIFSECPGLARLLTYISQKYWEGKADELKEYSLGVEALGRRRDFDPARSAIVRVNVHRLREKLKKYYEAEGAGHQLRIEIHPGHYTPQFIENCDLQTRAAPDPGRHHDGISGDVDGFPGSGSRARVSSTGRPGGSILVRWRYIPILIGAAALAAILWFVLVMHPARSVARIKPGQVAEQPDSSLSSVRILAGVTTDQYVDHDGEAWLSDRYFHGGYARVNPAGTVLRTLDPEIFASCRMGDFSYNIPLKPGDYQLWLYFVEAFFGPGAHQGGGGVASRVFNVLANGRPLLNSFDIMADAGGNLTADVRVFKDIRPASDGYLHLAFVRGSSDPLIDAIKIEPGIPGRLLPVRIVAQDISYTGERGERWSADRYFEGGSLATWPRAGDSAQSGLYAGERFGNFTYAIPVAPGKYTVKLYFCEHFFGPNEPGGGGAGSRVFDVYSDGTTLLKNFDVFKEAGGWRKPAVKVFHGLEPNPQGKIDLQFDSKVNYALVNAISVTDEAGGGSSR